MNKNGKRKQGHRAFLPSLMFAAAVAFALYTFLMEDYLTGKALRDETRFHELIVNSISIAREKISPEPYRSGKILLINPRADNNGLWIEPLFHELPETLQAQRVEEVESIIILDYIREPYDAMADNDIYTWNAVLSIIDLQKKAIVHRVLIEGEPPFTEEDTEGPKPDGEVRAFLTSLDIRN